MDKIDILIWALGGGLTILFGSIIFGWKSLKDEMISLREEFKRDIVSLKSELRGEMTSLRSELKEDIKDVKEELKKDIKEVKEDLKKLTEQTSNIDKRVYGIERVLEMKECCILKADEKIKKAE